MKVCGIIAEYDPFHRGHLYHLNQAREQSRADYMVCVLGCAFSQRGDAMLFDSFARAKMALDNGFDLVLGMPVSFSCAQANRFARGGVGILNSLVVITHLSFGSESARLNHLSAAARMLNHPDEVFTQALKQGLEDGASFAKAQGQALSAALPVLPETLLSSPNFILGVSFLRELDSLGSGITPLPIARAGSYHSKAAGPLASASAVRAKLLADPGANLEAECPDASRAVINKATRHLPDALDKVLLAGLLGKTGQELCQYSEMSEGLEDRILAQARKAKTREELISLVKTKRYPYARINRALSQALLDMRHLEITPEYARLLGMRKRAKQLLKAMDQSGFSLVSRPARSKLPGIEQDMRAEELWRIGAGQSAQEAWKRNVIVID